MLKSRGAGLFDDDLPVIEGWLRTAVSRVCYVMMVLVSHPDAIVSKEQATYTWLGTQAPRYVCLCLCLCVCVYVCPCVSQPLERDLNREPRPVAPRVNSKMSKLEGKDREVESGAGAIRSNDLFTWMGRVMN